VNPLEIRTASRTGDFCGEGPVWCAEEQSLYWTDINRFFIHRLDSSKTVRTWVFDEPVTALALTARPGTLAVALGSRLIYWTAASDERRDHGFHLPGWPHVRLNDGRPDPRGSFWVGSMRNNVAPDGSSMECGGTDGVLFRIDPDGSVLECKRDIGIANTLAWSPDQSHFYFADTLLNTIYVYDYDAATGDISGERPFFTGFDRGMPDGSAVDTEGCLWNCRWGGACIVRIEPGGSIDRIVEMPAQNITSCTFGGPDLQTLYVTSALLGADSGDLLAGSLFAIETGVRGLPEHKFL
jgi:sugar lactone lactonase YvrE